MKIVTPGFFYYMTKQLSKKISKVEVDTRLAKMTDEQSLTDLELVAPLNQGNFQAVEEELHLIETATVIRNVETTILDEAYQYIEVQENSTASYLLF